MKISFNSDMLTFADENHTSLTLECQESVKRILLEEAIRMAYKEKNAQNTPQQTYCYYYKGLASFMIQNPNVLIEPVLLKPDLSRSNL